MLCITALDLLKVIVFNYCVKITVYLLFRFCGSHVNHVNKLPSFMHQGLLISRRVWWSKTKLKERNFIVDQASQQRISHIVCSLESFGIAAIPRLFSGPSSVQALGISPSYHFPISICRASSLLPSLIGAFQAIQFVAPILLNDQFSKRTLLISPVQSWQIWINLAWVDTLHCSHVDIR